MPNKDLYIVTYCLCVGTFSLDDSFYYGPSSLKACESFIEHRKNVVCDVTYYKVKPVKGRYIWEETNDDNKIKKAGKEIERNLQEAIDNLEAFMDSYKKASKPSASEMMKYMREICGVVDKYEEGSNHAD